ncbi:MAG: serine O-acetyltransferase [Eubacteriales bacterium]
MRNILTEVKRVEKSLKGRITNDLISIKQEIDSDVYAVLSRDPAPHTYAEVLLTHQGTHAILAHRVAHALYMKEHRVSARVISQFSRAITGIEIHPRAEIGRGLLIDHGSGVVIGETAVIGDGCTIFQGVTLGGRGNRRGKRHPTLRDGVFVGAGAKLLGDIEIGKGAKIGANAVVLCSVGEGKTAIGVPARIIEREK